MTQRAPELVALAQRELLARADPEKAPIMQAYMKTEMPFLGVQRPFRAEVERMLRVPALGDRAVWAATVQGLWELPHREGKYLAIEVLLRGKRHLDLAALPLCRRLIIDGAWWDLVDMIATKGVGRIWAVAPEEMGPIMDRWIADPDLWVRRSAVIGQLKHKDQTDAGRLFGYCAARAHEKEFFMRKAIGWALREYSKTDAPAVRRFLQNHQQQLSGLSLREASKHMVAQDLLAQNWWRP